VLGATVGLRFCMTDLCRARGDYDGSDRIGGGGGLRLFGGYRFIPYLAAVLDVGIAGQRVAPESSSTVRASVFSWNAVASVIVHPLAFSRFDPYLGIGAGYNEDIQRADYDEDGYSERIRQRSRRGLVRATVGLDIYVKPRLSLGPRLEYERHFAGKLCFESTTSAEECTKIDKLSSSERTDLPRWIIVGFSLTAHL